MNKVKLFLTSMLWVMYFIIEKLYRPALTNSIALTQFDNSIESFTNYQTNQAVWEYVIPMLVFTTLLIYLKEIKKLFKKLKERI